MQAVSSCAKIMPGINGKITRPGIIAPGTGYYFLLMPSTSIFR